MDNQNYSSSTTDTNIKLEESHPDEALNYFNSGLTLYHQQKYDEAIAQYQKTTEIKSNDVGAYCSMNITTSVDSSDKLNCFQGVVDESTSTKRYISQTQSI